LGDWAWGETCAGGLERGVRVWRWWAAGVGVGRRVGGEGGRGERGGGGGGGGWGAHRGAGAGER